MVSKVPQFIEVEDKIFGPLTFKQFLYLVGGGAACFVIWSLVPQIIAVVLILAMAGLALALAFYRVNNRPFSVLLESFVHYHLGGKLYLWNKSVPKASALKKMVEKEVSPNISKISSSKLSDLAWSLDVNETTQ